MFVLTFLYVCLVGALILNQEVCTTLENPPSNATSNILPNTDFVTGSFARMVRSNAILDTTNTVGYQDILIFLAEEDMKLNGGIITDDPSLDKYELRFFIGMAHIKGTNNDRISTEFSSVEMRAEIGTSFMFTTTAFTENTFITDVNVGLIQVKNNNVTHPKFEKFARIQLGVPPGLTADDVTGLVPATSVQVSIGYTPSTTSDLMYPCVTLYDGAQKVQIDNLLTSRLESGCGFGDQVCAIENAVVAGSQVYLMIPLGEDIWEDSDLSSSWSKNLFVSFFVNLKNANGNLVKSLIQTTTEVSALSIVTLCTEETTTSTVSDLVTVDMFLGLTESEALFNQSLIQGLDITRNKAAGQITRDVSSIASNVVTLLVKGDATTLDQDFAVDYSIEVEDMISIHFLENSKHAQVAQMIQDGTAFKKVKDPNSVTMLRLQPTEELLGLCPIQAMEGIYGCVTRLDVNERVNDYRTNSVISFAPNSTNTKEEMQDDVSSWIGELLGGSDFVKTLGRNHSGVMIDKYQLNSRYRKGYMIKPTVPWRQTDMDQSSMINGLDLSQHTITAVLISMDQNRDSPRTPTVEMSVKVDIPVTGSDLLQPDVIADIIDSVTGSTTSGEQTGTRRRNLLQTKSATVTYDMLIGIPMTNVDNAMKKAIELRTNMLSDNSMVIQQILRRINTKLLTMQSTSKITTLLSPDYTITQPKVVPLCYNTKDWEIDIKKELGIQFQTAVTADSAHLSCNKRWIKQGTSTLRSVDISIRGPQKQADWDKYIDHSAYVSSYMSDPYSDIYPTVSITSDQDYNFVTDKNQQYNDWLWWDMCDQPPAGKFYTAEFMTKWNSLQKIFSENCCLCNSKPKIATTRIPYKHQYSWPIKTNTISDMNMYDTAQIMLVNPQIRNFKSFPRAYVPDTWGVENDGTTVTTKCNSGMFLETPILCSPCKSGTFSKVVPGTKTITKCSQCPENTFSPIGSVSQEQCICMQGYTRSNKHCVTCPENTFKDTNGDGRCTPCKTGLFARIGAVSESQCSFVYTPGKLDNTFFLYEEVLGLLGDHSITEDVSRCKLTLSGKSLSCPGKLYEREFMSRSVVRSDKHGSVRNYQSSHSMLESSPNNDNSLFVNTNPCSSTPLVVHGIERPDLNCQIKNIGIEQTRGYMGIAPGGLNTRISKGVSWIKGTTISAKLRLEIPSIDLTSKTRENMVRIVMIITDKQLSSAPTSNDWKWIICGKFVDKLKTKTSYDICNKEMDVDNKKFTNTRNFHVLDATVLDLNTEHCCQSCYSESVRLQDCVEQNKIPTKNNMYDNTLEWTPFKTDDIKSISKSTDMFFYTYFMVGDSEACEHHNCNENIVYTHMHGHTKTQYNDKPVIIEILPGTELTYKSPSSIFKTLKKETSKKKLQQKYDILRQRHKPKINHRRWINTRDQVPTNSKTSSVIIAGSEQKRRLLQTTSGSDSAEGPVDAVASHEITDIVNDEIVTKAVCADTTCSMYRLTIEVPPQIYCEREKNLIQNYRSQIETFMTKSVNVPVDFVYITSAYRSRFVQACFANTPGRRLLTSQEVSFSVVVNAPPGSCLEIQQTGSNIQLQEKNCSTGTPPSNKNPFTVQIHREIASEHDHNEHHDHHYHEHMENGEMYRALEALFVIFFAFVLFFFAAHYISSRYCVAYEKN